MTVLVNQFLCFFTFYFFFYNELTKSAKCGDLRVYAITTVFLEWRKSPTLTRVWVRLQCEKASVRVITQLPSRTLNVPDKCTTSRRWLDGFIHLMVYSDFASRITCFRSRSEFSFYFTQCQSDVAFWFFDVGSSYHCLAAEAKCRIVHPPTGNVSWV